MLLDCGLRISELLNLAYNQVDLDNLVLRIKGKGTERATCPHLNGDEEAVLHLHLQTSWSPYLSHQHPHWQ